MRNVRIIPTYMAKKLLTQEQLLVRRYSCMRTRHASKKHTSSPLEYWYQRNFFFFFLNSKQMNLPFCKPAHIDVMYGIVQSIYSSEGTPKEGAPPPNKGVDLSIWVMCENTLIYINCIGQHSATITFSLTQPQFQKRIYFTYLQDHQVCGLSPIPPVVFFSSLLTLILIQTCGSGPHHPPWQCFKKPKNFIFSKNE